MKYITLLLLVFLTGCVSSSIKTDTGMEATYSSLFKSASGVSFTVSDDGIMVEATDVDSNAQVIQAIVEAVK